MAKAKSEDKKKRSGIREYFRGIRIEMKKVVWPSKSELVSYTWVVVLTCAVLALGFWAIDSGCALALQKLLGIDVTL